MVVAIIIAFGSAVVGAFLGAYLQRRWTPDPRPDITTLGEQLTAFHRHVEASDARPQIAALATQLDAFRQRVETIERERTELKNFSLELSLQSARMQYYQLSAKNNSDKKVRIETVNVEYEGVPLSRPSKPKAGEDWTIGPGESKQISWEPQPDPVSQLMYGSRVPPSGKAVPMTFVLVCSVEGRSKIVKGIQIVTVETSGRVMTAFGP